MTSDVYLTKTITKSYIKIAKEEYVKRFKNNPDNIRLFYDTGDFYLALFRKDSVKDILQFRLETNGNLTEFRVREKWIENILDIPHDNIPKMRSDIKEITNFMGEWFIEEL